MSDFSATAHNPFDETRPYLLSLYMTLVGYSVLVARPAINSAWVDQLGFTEVEVNLHIFNWKVSFLLKQKK